MRGLMIVMAVAMAAGAGARSARAEGMDVALGVGVLPGGDATFRFMGDEASMSLDGGYAVGVELGGFVRPWLRIAGLGGVQGGLQTDSLGAVLDGALFDVRMIGAGGRLELHREVHPRVRLYTFGQTGYSRTTLRSELESWSDSADGVAVAGGLGGRVAFDHQFSGFAELGYQWATHRFTQPGPDLRMDVTLFSLRAGISLGL